MATQSRGSQECGSLKRFKSSRCSNFKIMEHGSALLRQHSFMTRLCSLESPRFTFYVESRGYSSKPEPYPDCTLQAVTTRERSTHAHTFFPSFCTECVGRSPAHPEPAGISMSFRFKQTLESKVNLLSRNWDLFSYEKNATNLVCFFFFFFKARASLPSNLRVLSALARQTWEPSQLLHGIRRAGVLPPMDLKSQMGRNVDISVLRKTSVCVCPCPLGTYSV